VEVGVAVAILVAAVLLLLVIYRRLKKHGGERL
jgi:hypothetical protein